MWLEREDSKVSSFRIKTNPCITGKVTLDTKNLGCRKEQGPGNRVSASGRKAGMYKFCVKCAFVQLGKGCEDRMGCSLFFSAVYYQIARVHYINLSK